MHIFIKARHTVCVLIYENVAVSNWFYESSHVGFIIVIYRNSIYSGVHKGPVSADVVLMQECVAQ